MNGSISADGADAAIAHLGGGAGGSIVISSPVLEGFGSMTADGGNGMGLGGGGGGGRIALQCVTNLFSGTLSALGGLGYQAGGAGTIYTAGNQGSPRVVFISNGGVVGTNTLLSNVISQDDVIITGGATVVSSASHTAIRSLTISSNAWMVFSNQSLAAFEAIIEQGGGIRADGNGSGPAMGLGRGAPGAGGSHGGVGARNPPNTFGQVYGSVQSPNQTGSGGGGPSAQATAGGFGGGSISLNFGSLHLDGFISANGTEGGFNSGGGSGGSVSVQTARIAGSGRISARGGAGIGTGGGGGGGRIALNTASNGFTGTISAAGGGGAARGGAGTIYLAHGNNREVVVHNDGIPGTNTPLGSPVVLPSPFDLTIHGGGRVNFGASGSPNLNNLVIGQGGVLVGGPNFANLEILVRNDLLMNGGEISADGLGFGMGQGPGSGLDPGVGGGHGGDGGGSIFGAPGGTTYGFLTHPTERGSGGSAGTGFGSGGSEGGGAIRIWVLGRTTMNGRISANGNPGLQDGAGGGAGGSIWLTSGALEGVGSIWAEGGRGELFDGSGGGGGRVAIYSPSNSFTGLVSVAGGFGAIPGQQGTIFTASQLPNFEVISQTPSTNVLKIATSIELAFTGPIDFSTLSGTDFEIETPTGTLSGTNWSITPVRSSGIRIGPMSLTTPGAYTLRFGPDVSDLFGRSQGYVHVGTFAIVAAVISGKVTELDGSPLQGVFVELDDEGNGMLTDTNGVYVMPFEPGATLTLTPQLTGYVFQPSSRTYVQLGEVQTDQDFVAIKLAPRIAMSVEGTNLGMTWFGVAGFHYQVQYSTNLVEWFPLGDSIPGGNSMQELSLPVEGGPLQFFRILVTQ